MANEVTQKEEIIQVDNTNFNITPPICMSMGEKCLQDDLPNQ